VQDLGHSRHGPQSRRRLRNDDDEAALDEALINRFDYDDVFGTRPESFLRAGGHWAAAQLSTARAVRRAVSSISAIPVRCIEIACHNPAARGECRVYNQFTEQFSVLELAHLVESAARKLGVRGQIDHIPDPRVEAEQHYYNAKHSKLGRSGPATA